MTSLRVFGKDGRDYIPYLITVVLYIGIANMIGLLDSSRPPRIQMTVSGRYEHCAGGSRRNQEKGVKGWVKSFAEPIAIIAPINVLELFIRPLSLYAIVRQCSGRHCGHGIDQASPSVDRAAAVQFLL